MAQERLQQLQELSKGKEIIDVNFPSINVAQLMRETNAGIQPQTWEVYAKKVIGPDITIIKRFTSDGQVSVVERNGSVLSTGQYPLEDGEKYFGEGYLQIEPRQNYRSYIKDIELVGLASLGSPSTSPGLAEEFKSWMEEANPAPAVQLQPATPDINALILVAMEVERLRFKTEIQAQQIAAQKLHSESLEKENQSLRDQKDWDNAFGAIDKAAPSQSDKVNPILLAGLSQKNQELRVLRAQMESQGEDHEGEINDLQAEIASLSLALESQAAASSGVQVDLPTELEVEEVLDDSEEEDGASVATGVTAARIVSRGPITPSYVQTPDVAPAPELVSEAGDEEAEVPSLAPAVAVAVVPADPVSVPLDESLIDGTRPYDVETDGKHINGVNGNGNGKNGSHVFNGKPHIFWENERRHTVAATTTAVAVLERPEGDASVVSPDIVASAVVEADADLDLAAQPQAPVDDQTLWELYEADYQDKTGEAQLLEVNEVEIENPDPQIDLVEIDDLEDLPWPGLRGIDDVNPVLESTVSAPVEAIVIPENREVRIRLPKLPLEGIHSHDRSKPEAIGARNFEIAIESLPSRESLGVNQDVVLFDTSDKTLFGLSDGVRASKGAQRAADLTALVMKERISEIPSDSHPDKAQVLMKEALIEANNRINEQQLENPEFSDMQSTGSYIKLITRGIANWIVWGNVGDSRIAILRNGKIIELTEDDEERLGKSREIKPKTGKYRLRSTDKVLFYTNGIHKRLSTEAIEKVLYKRSNLGIMAEEVMKLAKYQSDDEDRDSTMAILRLLQSK